MNIKKINNAFGYILFSIGGLKTILLILILIKLLSSLNSISDANEINVDLYSAFSTALGFVQLFTVIGSIIMIIINLIKGQAKMILGYLYGFGAILIELLVPSIMGIFTVLFECSLYMKGGSKIIKESKDYINYYGTDKKMVKNTEWFYSDQEEKNKTISVKEQRRKEKLEKELVEWKQLLDSGQIDENTYNEETAKLIEKERRKINKQ